ncbi:hypothetical protein M3Y97_00680100 [Aphelenchoides bicaudatus]|nr:hypothetical protein M3Y97_00680100 [Aphelenchoides bicaudatus]
MVAQERPTTQAPPPPKSQSTTSVTMESGYVSSAPSYTTDMSSTSMDFAMPPPPFFAETLTEEPLVDSAPYQQDQKYEPEMTEMEEIEDSIITTSFGAPPEKPVEEQRVMKEQITERPNRMEQKETDEAEVDEDVWMQPQQQYRLPESWEPKSPGRMWTTVFSDDGDMAASEYDESTSGPFSYQQSGQEPSAPPPYSDTQPYLERRVKASSPSSFKAIADELPPAEEAFAKEYLIYADRDQQDFLEQYGRVESGIETTTSRHFNDTTPDSKFYHDAFHSADGSFEVQMEDPFSPTSSGGIVEEAIEQTTKAPQQHFVAASTLPKRSPIAPAETGTLQSKKKKTPEITITSHEEEKDDDSDAETSPSDEDDYPDQVIEAPTAPMTSTHLIEQEQQRRSQNEYAQEVLRQIQSFGEAADDEFDVQWAASMTAKKEQQKDQPNGHLPFVSAAEQSQVQPEIQQEKPPQQQLQQPSQRINPFLESPEPEDEDTVTVEQVSLDSDDIDYHQAIQYYKGSHQELYHHRPGPVYTIPEGDEGVEAKGDRKLKPQLLERRALHTTQIPTLVSEDAKKKQQGDAYTTGHQLSKKPVESSDATTPTKPIRTAPPPPDSSNLPPGTEDPNQIGRIHKFTPETHQVDDLLPASAYTHHNHVARGMVASVGESDASFLAQTFGMQPKKPESSTLGSQLSTADHSVIEVVDDSTMSKLKRSPAMSILSSSKPPQTEDVLPQVTGAQKSLLSREEENALLGLHSAQQQIPTSQQQHDLLLLSSSDMGRRKLPTLPQGQTAPYHQIPSVSAATEKSAETSHRFDASTSAASRISQQPLPATLYKYGYSTVGYTHHPPSHHHPIDPAILPGAPFRTAQPASIATVPKRPGIIGTARSASVSPKLSDTMSQLLFKQELRQALSRRRHEQETVEIEANHREFLIRRMMNSGLIPPDCRRDIDSVPSVTKCDLPYELVAGARVVPADFYIHQHKRQYGTRQAYSQQTSPRHVDWTQGVLAGPAWTPSGQMPQTAMPTGAYRQSPTRRSVACQYEHSTTPKQYEAYHGSPLKVHYTPHERKAPKIDSSTQTMIASETQTDTAQVDLLRQESYHPTTYQSASTSYQPASGYQREERATSYVAPDLLDATRRYFETYDRRLKDTSDALLKHQRFQFSDATNPQEMEWKREQVRRELEHRKQKVASMIDLRSLQQQQRPWDNMPADYSTRLPASSQRYGSLPRRFNAAATDVYSLQDTSSRRTNLYGSLPRNFERGDLYDSTGFYSLPQQQLPSAYTRSAAQLDRQYYPSYFDTTPVRRRPASYDDLTGRLAADNLTSRQFAADDYNAARRVDEYGTNVADDMLLSQYANYVNTQINAAGFLDDPLLTETNRYAGQSYPSASQNYLSGTTYPSTYPASAQAYIATYPGVATPDYTPPLSDYTYADRVFNAQSQPVASYITDYAGELPRVNIPNQSIYNQRSATYDPRLQPTYDLSLPSGSATYDPRLSTTTGDYVYSRRENNYGSRPAQPIGNYGNFAYQTMRAGNPNLNAYQQRSTWNTLPASYITNPQWESTQRLPTSLYDRQQVVQPTDLYAQRSFDERWPAGYSQQPQRIPYSCSTQPRAVPQPYSQTSAFQAKARARANPLLLQGIPKRRGCLQPTVNVIDTASLGRNEKRKVLASKAHKANVRSGQSMMNINDLGFRVTGGKRLSNGDLGAFVTAVNHNKAYDTLGELKEGDQVLEWNGILLRGKTFEEVERIINATSGEIEVVIKCADAKNHKHQRSENIYDLTSDEIKRGSHQKQDYTFSPRDAPPIPAHRKSLSHSYYDQEDISRKQRLHYKIHSDDETLGQLQICLGYDQLNSLLLVTIISAHGLTSREYNGSIVLPNPFVKIYMLPGRKVINKRRTNLSNIQLLDNAPRWFDLQPADKPIPTRTNGTLTGAPYSKPRTLNSSYFYNPANLDLSGYPAI